MAAASARGNTWRSKRDQEHDGHNRQAGAAARGKAMSTKRRRRRAREGMRSWLAQLEPIVRVEPEPAPPPPLIVCVRPAPAIPPVPLAERAVIRRVERAVMSERTEEMERAC